MAEFPDILLSAGKSKKRGSVALSGSGPADSRLIFNAKAKPVEIALTEVQFVNWMEVGKGLTEGNFVVKLGLKGSQPHIRRMHAHECG